VELCWLCWAANLFRQQSFLIILLLVVAVVAVEILPAEVGPEDLLLRLHCPFQLERHIR
jgi:hypothetical protein